MIKRPNPLKSLGIEPFIPTIPPVIGEVVPDSPAEKRRLCSLVTQLLSVDGENFMIGCFFRLRSGTGLTHELSLKIRKKKERKDIKLLTGTQQNHR